MRRVSFVTFGSALLLACVTVSTSANSHIAEPSPTADRLFRVSAPRPTDIEIDPFEAERAGAAKIVAGVPSPGNCPRFFRSFFGWSVYWDIC